MRIVWLISARREKRTDHAKAIVDGLDNVGAKWRAAGGRIAAAREVDAGDERRLGEDDAYGRGHVKMGDALARDHLEHLLDIELRRQLWPDRAWGPGS